MTPLAFLLPPASTVNTFKPKSIVSKRTKIKQKIFLFGEEERVSLLAIFFRNKINFLSCLAKQLICEYVLFKSHIQKYFIQENNGLRLLITYTVEFIYEAGGIFLISTANNRRSFWVARSLTRRTFPVGQVLNQHTKEAWNAERRINIASVPPWTKETSVKIELLTIIDNIHSKQTYNYFHGRGEETERKPNEARASLISETPFNFRPPSEILYIYFHVMLIFSQSFLSFIFHKHDIVTSNGGF